MIRSMPTVCMLRMGPGAFTGSRLVEPGVRELTFADGTERSRLVWMHDTLPDKLTGWLSTAMDQLLPVFQKALRSSGEAQRP
jgi:hypothetical protein